MKNVSIMLAMVFVFMGSTCLFADNLETMKTNIKNRSNKHIENIKNFQNCIEKTKKMEQIKIFKDNMNKKNIEIQNSK
jgi:hypothetical protein